MSQVALNESTKRVEVSSKDVFAQILKRGEKTPFIVVAGQSNTGHSQHGITLQDPLPAGIDTTIMQLGEDALGQSGLLTPLTSGSINTNHNAAGVRYSGVYELALGVKAALGLDGLVVITVSSGSTGFFDSEWTADSALYYALIQRVKLMVQRYNGEMKGLFWFGGEDEQNHTTATVYKQILANFVNSVRESASQAGHRNAYSIPFVPYQIKTTASALNGVRTALATVDSYINHSAPVELSGLPSDDASGDTVHYTIRQSSFLCKAMADALPLAIENNLDVTVPAGMVKLFNYDATVPRPTDMWDTLNYGDPLVDSSFSMFSEVWKYRKDGKFKFRLEYTVVGSSTVEFIEFEQANNPLFSHVSTVMSAIITSKSVNADVGSGGNFVFNGLTYSSAIETGSDTLICLGVTWDRSFGVASSRADFRLGRASATDPWILAQTAALYVIT